MADEEVYPFYISEYRLMGEDGVLIPIGTRTESNRSVRIKKGELDFGRVEMATYRGIECRACLNKFNLTLPLPFFNGRLGYNYEIVGVSGYHPEFISVENPEYNQYRELKATTDGKGTLKLNPGHRYTSMPSVHVGVRRKFVFKPEIRPITEGVDAIYVRAF